MKTKHLLSLLIAGLLAASSALQAQTTAVPDRISYQGFVTDLTGTAVGGTGTVNRTVIFRVWDSATASASANLLYSEQQTVTITAGEFSVLVGGGANVTTTPLGFSETAKGPGTVNINSVFGASSRFLGVTVDDGTAAADTEVTPRHQIVTTAYTFRARLAEGVTAGAITSAMIGAGAITGANIGSTTITNANLANTTITDAKLDVISAAGKVANSATTATASNNANTIVLRDGSGNFSAGTITANLNGNAVNVTGTVAIANGGTGSTTKNFVDLTTAQTVAGAKTFSGVFNVTNAGSISPTNGQGGLNVGMLTSDHLAMNVNNLSAYGGAGNTPSALNLNHSGGNLIINGSGNAGNVGLRTIAPPRSILELSPATGTLDGIILGKISDTASRFVGIHGSTVSLTNDSGFSGIELGGPAGSGEGFLAFHTHDSGVSSGERMRIDKSGNVGIGTIAPSSALQVVGRLNATTAIIGSGNVNSAPLQVNSQGTAGIGNHRTYGESSVESASGTSSATASIYAIGFINAAGFRAFSDERIKNISGVTSGAEDLKTLLGVEVTNYTYKDVVARGNKSQKKLIAQQVESVYPAAVSRGTDCVPDIYKMAEINDGWVSLKTNLKIGERVRLMADKEEGVYEVLEVREGSFRTAFVPKEDSIFVYGREVKDFRTVDYEAISMLNVSATQEIARRLEAKTAEVAALEARVKKLEARDKARDAKLAAFEKLLDAMEKPAARTVSLKTGAE